MTKQIKSGRKIPLQNRSRERVELILDCTATLLAEIDLSEITTSRISKKAKIPVGSIYQYFKDREEILLALGERVLREEDLLITKTIEEIGIQAHWRRIAKSLIDAFSQHILENNIHYQLDIALSNNPAWQELILASEERSVQLITAHPLFTKKNIERQKAIDSIRVVVVTVAAVLKRTRLESTPEKTKALLSETENMIIAYLATLFGN